MPTFDTTSDVDGKRRLRLACKVLGVDYDEALAEAQALCLQNLRPLGTNCLTVAHSLFEQDRQSSQE